MLAAAALGSAACSDDADALSGTRRTKAGASSGGVEGADGGAVGVTLTQEREAFNLVEPDLVRLCGKTCHDTGTFSPPPPVFLAPPDVYTSIKAQPGVVVRDVFASTLLTKGPHAGPAVSSDPEFEKKVLAWLEAESLAIQSQQLPTTPPVSVVLGPNDIDLTPAAATGLTGVHLKFEAALLGTILSLSKITLVAAAGTDVHILKPRFVRVLAQPAANGDTEFPDPADSFSNSDQTVAGGKETALSPGSVLFSAATWRPFDPATDKIRIEVTKLEPGKVSVIAAAAKCKDVNGFATRVLPTLRNTQAGGNNCQGCHGQGLAGLSLAGNDNEVICQQVLGKLDKANIPESLIVKKVTGGTHSGGAVGDANAWRQLFVGNAGVFF